MKSFRKLLQYLKPYMFFAIIGPLFMVLEVAMDLIQPTIMQHIIDVGIANRDMNYVIKNGTSYDRSCSTRFSWRTWVYDVFYKSSC
ncbi:hypothetical protein ACT7DH_06880 [Bacillus pacificus]